MCFPNMTVPKRVMPASKLPPESEKWGREQQALAEANRDALNSTQHAIVACMREAFSAHGCAPPEDVASRRVIGLSLDEAVTR